MKWSMALVLLLLAGCSGAVDDGTTEGRTAASSSDAAAQEGYDYALFLGLTGTEGDLNWTAYEEALREAADPGATIAEVFDQDVDNGDPGDGLLGSWLTTHFIFDEEQQLLGGLYTQYHDGETRSAFAPFLGPYAGTTQLPSLTGALPSGLFEQRGAQEQVLCGLLSNMDDLDVDSREAAQIAAQRPVFKEHVKAHPGGEYTYYYFPQLAVEAGCDAELDVESNYWVISHTDLDAYLEGHSATVAEVRIDAATGKVLDEGIRPLFERPPITYEHVLPITDPLVPSSRPYFHNVSFLVTEDATRITVDVIETEHPEGALDPRTRLRDPLGRIIETRSLAEGSHTYTMRDPMPGTWRLEYVYQSVQPGGEHRIAAKSTVQFD